MNSLKNLISDTPRSFIWLGILIAFILLLGNAIAITTLYKTSIQEEYFSRPLCFQNQCIKEYIECTDQFFTISKATFELGVAIATIGGIFVALLSYFNTASNAALTNHIEHLKVFSEYLDSEIKKRSRLSSDLFDTLLLYATIFHQSRSGKTTVSDDYKNLILDLNKIIEESNERSIKGTPGGFSYRDHQRKIRDLLYKVGITVYIAPRNDYLEMEEQLFSLIHRISQSFCTPNTIREIAKRNYQ